MVSSDELRRWFGHDPSKWGESKRRYAEELKGNLAFETLRRLVSNSDVTLLYSARDRLRNNATALKEFLKGGI